jgi:hypothetical protein
MNDSPTAAHQRYRNAKGEIVPGVTTVIGLLAKPALVGWAWKLGMQGEDMNKVRDMAADIGTATHYMVECRLKGEEPDFKFFTPYVIECAKKMLPAFDSYAKSNPAKLLASEKQVVSEKWQYGGCIDWVCVPKSTGLVTLRDIKTSAGIYDEYKIQLAAYQVAWNEIYPDQPIEAVEAIHLDKKSGLLTVHPFGDLSQEFLIFKHLRAIYILQKKGDPKRNKSAVKGYRKTGKLGEVA